MAARATATRATTTGGRRRELEEWLEENGVDWVYEERLRLGDIDRDKSLANQARHEALDPELVDQYREAIRRGDQFPALVVARAGVRSKAVTVDGNHRMEAARGEGLETFGAYVIRARPTSNQIQSMTQAANVHHGKVTAREERIQSALWHIDTRGMGVERAAARVNLPVSQVRSRYEKVRADRRADEVGLRRSDWDTLSPTVRTRLLSIGTDEGFKAAARLAVDARLTTAQVDELVATLHEFARSAARQEQLVRAMRRDYADRISAVASGEAPPGRRAGFTPRRRLTLAVSNLLALPDDFASSLAGSFRDEDERHKAALEAREAAHRLETLASALEG